MKKKILLVTLATVLTLSMTACGGKETETPATDVNTTVEQTVETPEPTTSPEVEQTEEAKDEQSGLTISEVTALVETMATVGTYTYDDGLAALMTENNVSAEFARDVLNAYIMEHTDAFPAVLDTEETTEIGMESPAWMNTEAFELLCRDVEANTGDESRTLVLKRKAYNPDLADMTDEEYFANYCLGTFFERFAQYFMGYDVCPGRSEIIAYASSLFNTSVELTDEWLITEECEWGGILAEDGTVNENGTEVGEYRNFHRENDTRPLSKAYRDALGY